MTRKNPPPPRLPRGKKSAAALLDESFLREIETAIEEDRKKQGASVQDIRVLLSSVMDRNTRRS